MKIHQPTFIEASGASRNQIPPQNLPIYDTQVQVKNTDKVEVGWISAIAMPSLRNRILSIRSFFHTLEAPYEVVFIVPSSFLPIPTPNSYSIVGTFFLNNESSMRNVSHYWNITQVTANTISLKLSLKDIVLEDMVLRDVQLSIFVSVISE